MKQIAFFLVGLATPARDREFVVGDTVEEFDRIERSQGSSAAHRWLRHEMWRVLLWAPLVRLRAQAAVPPQPASKGDRMPYALWQDVRCAVRSVMRTPAFTASAVLTLALGIGANTAIFSLIEALILRTVPVHAAHELYFIAHGARETPGTMSNYPLFERFRERTDIFAGVTFYTESDPIKVSMEEAIELTPAQFVGANYHRVLGVPMALGRGFTAESDAAGTDAAAAVISYGYWTRRFGRDPNALGRTLVVNGHRVTIIGVSAAGFDGLLSGMPQDITLPFAVRTLDDPDFFLKQSGWWSVPLVARLKPGVSESRAAAVVDTMFRQYLLEPPNQWYRGPGGRIPTSFLAPAAHGSGTLRSRYSPALAVLMGIVGVVLLIACVNLANLMLARGAARSREVAVRISLGAGRLQLIRLFLTESLLLTSLGGVLGLLLAVWGTRVIAALFSTGPVSIVIDVQVNATVLAFTAAVSILATTLIGLAPAVNATRVQVSPALKQGGPPGWRLGGWRARQLLVVGQTALCVLLLAGSGLLVRTLQNLQAREAGFSPENVLMFTLDARGTAAPPGQLPGLCDRLLERLRGRTGAASAACSSSVPAHTRGNAGAMQLPGAAPGPEKTMVWMTFTSPGYFSTYGVTLLRGRSLTDEDSAGSPRVAVVNESTARTFFGAEDPIGRSIHGLGRPKDAVTIVGVVRDTVQNSFRRPAPLMMYMPLAQARDPQSILFVGLRSSRQDANLVPSISSEVRTLSRDVVIDYFRTMTQQIDAMLVQERVVAMLSAWFGVLALVLACVGLYSVMAYEVGRRLRDIGISLALGARPTGVLGDLLRQTGVVVAAGIVLGLAGAFGATRLIESLLYGLTPRDPATLAGAAAALAITGLIAGYFPARRAARVDPVVALRAE